jgi:hypothetical protein
MQTPLVPITGSPSSWARDFAILGGFTGSFAPLCVIGDVGFAAVGALVGAATGAVVGVGLRGLLERMRATLPLRVMILVAPVIGAVTGRPRWPLVALACLIAPTLGWGALVALFTSWVWVPAAPVAIVATWFVAGALTRRARKLARARPQRALPVGTERIGI